MNPILFKIFNIPVYSFGFFVAVGFILATVSAIEIGKKYNVNANDIVDLSVWVLVAGIVGARILYVIVNFDYFMDNPRELIMLNHGGLVYYGGLIGAILAFILFLKSKPISLLKMGDIIAASLPVGQMFGRIGCFLNGCCFGKPSVFSLRITYPVNSIPFSHYQEFQPIHPVQLYESLGTGIVFLILISIIERKKFDGQIIFLYGILYGTLRFSLEFLRGDVSVYLLELTLSQYISLIFVVFCTVLYFVFAKKKNIIKIKK